jgi:hypothetical protein
MERREFDKLIAAPRLPDLDDGGRSAGPSAGSAAAPRVLLDGRGRVGVTGIRRDDEKALPAGSAGGLRRIDPAEWFDKDHPEPMLASYELRARHLTPSMPCPQAPPRGFWG